MCSPQAVVRAALRWASWGYWGVAVIQMQVSLTLPREAVSVPLARHLLASTLERAGVALTTIDDVKLALTEACTNAYQHVEAGDTYEVRIVLDDDSLAIDVVDMGHGFEPQEPSGERHVFGVLDERGRGIDLIRALTDQATFDTVSAEGGIVRLRKRVDWVERSPWFVPTQESAGRTGDGSPAPT